MAEPGLRAPSVAAAASGGEGAGVMMQDQTTDDADAVRDLLQGGACTSTAGGAAGGRGKQDRQCGVCADRALGYNFNAITCESCKAFFRRNALKNKKLKCPFQDSCTVDVVTRRFCQKCRLRKCFDIGMKKEWIMTDEEKQKKKLKIEENKIRKCGNSQSRLFDSSEEAFLSQSPDMKHELSQSPTSSPPYEQSHPELHISSIAPFNTATSTIQCTVDFHNDQQSLNEISPKMSPVPPIVSMSPPNSISKPGSSSAASSFYCESGSSKPQAVVIGMVRSADNNNIASKISRLENQDDVHDRAGEAMSSSFDEAFVQLPSSSIQDAFLARSTDSLSVPPPTDYTMNPNNDSNRISDADSSPFFQPVVSLLVSRSPLPTPNIPVAAVTTIPFNSDANTSHTQKIPSPAHLLNNNLSVDAAVDYENMPHSLTSAADFRRIFCDNQSSSNLPFTPSPAGLFACDVLPTELEASVHQSSGRTSVTRGLSDILDTAVVSSFDHDDLSTGPVRHCSEENTPKHAEFTDISTEGHQLDQRSASYSSFVKENAYFLHERRSSSDDSDQEEEEQQQCSTEDTTQTSCSSSASAAASSTATQPVTETQSLYTAVDCSSSVAPDNRTAGAVNSTAGAVDSTAGAVNSTAGAVNSTAGGANSAAGCVNSTWGCVDTTSGAVNGTSSSDDWSNFKVLDALRAIQPGCKNDDLYHTSDDDNAMESIVNSAVLAEYSPFSLLGNKSSSESAGGGSLALTAAEQHKMRELQTANAAMMAPLSEDQGYKDQHNPSLINIINMTDIAIRRLIQMSKQLSSFSCLCTEDQIALLKGSCTEMMILRSVAAYDVDKDSWKIPEHHDKFKSIKLKVLKAAPGNVQVYDEHKRFILAFKPEWRHDQNIMLLLSAITLFTPSRPNVIHPQAIQYEQCCYLLLLKRYLESSLGGCEGRTVYGGLLERINDLRRLNENHLKLYMQVNPEEVRPLLIEIFDLKQRWYQTK